MTRGRPARFETTLHLNGRDLVARYDGLVWELSACGSPPQLGRSLLALLDEAAGDDPDALRAAIDAVLAAMDSDLPSLRDPTWNAGD